MRSSSCDRAEGSSHCHMHVCIAPTRMFSLVDASPGAKVLSCVLPFLWAKNLEGCRTLGSGMTSVASPQCPRCKKGLRSQNVWEEQMYDISFNAIAWGFQSARWRAGSPRIRVRVVGAVERGGCGVVGPSAIGRVEGARLSRNSGGRCVLLPRHLSHSIRLLSMIRPGSSG